jgi:hypothetical protein
MIFAIEPAPIRNDPSTNVFDERFVVVRYRLRLMPFGAAAWMFGHVDVYEMAPVFAIRGEMTRVRATHALANKKLAAIVTTWT